ncbi:MAG: hypothetical protein OEU93_07410, partial [Rubrivivax sp.]|nr:hypothetical protein [Rubrivivax sp.]
PGSLSPLEARRWEQQRQRRLQASRPDGLDGYCRDLSGRLAAAPGSRDAGILRELLHYAGALAGAGEGAAHNPSDPEIKR